MVPFGGPYMTFHWLANVSKTEKKVYYKNRFSAGLATAYPHHSHPKSCVPKYGILYHLRVIYVE